MLESANLREWIELVAASIPEMDELFGMLIGSSGVSIEQWMRS